MREFEDAKVAKTGRVYIMSVGDHKISMEGVAKVILDPADQAHIVQYIETA